MDLTKSPTASPPASSPAEVRAAGRRKILWGIVALTVAAAVFAGWATFRWWDARNDESIALAKTRDAVLISAHNKIETLQTLDYREVDEGLDAWLAVTSGDLHDQLAEVGAKDKKNLESAAMVTEGHVVQAAVIDLAASGDSASVIAAVETTMEPAEGEITLKRNRFSAELAYADGEWKLTSLEPVPVVSP